MFEIRNISPNDIESVFEFIKEENIKSNNIYKFLDNFLICKWEGSICGFGFGLIENEFFFIKSVFVKPNYRNKGIGSTIIKAFINKCDVQNINNLYIYGKDAEFYKRLQFTQITMEHFIQNKNIFFNIYEQTISSNIYFLHPKEYVFNSCCK